MELVTTGAEGIDWTGGVPYRPSIAPLTNETFAIRLRLLTERAHNIDRLIRVHRLRPIAQLEDIQLRSKPD